jgi:hypothetical protein
VPSVTSQYSDGSRELRSVSPAAVAPEMSLNSGVKYGAAYQNLPTRVASGSYGGSDGSASRHSLDRLSGSRDALQAAATPPPPPLPKRGEGSSSEGRFDGHFTKYLKQQQPQCYDEPKPVRLGSPLRDNYVERGNALLTEPAAALSPNSVPLDLSKKKKPEPVFR